MLPRSPRSRSSTLALVLSASALALLIAALALGIVIWSDRHGAALVVHLPAALQGAIWQSLAIAGDTAAASSTAAGGDVPGAGSIARSPFEVSLAWSTAALALIAMGLLVWRQQIAGLAALIVFLNVLYFGEHDSAPTNRQTLSQLRAKVNAGEVDGVQRSLASLPTRDAALRAYVFAQAVFVDATRDGTLKTSQVQRTLHTQIATIGCVDHGFMLPRTLAALEVAAYGAAWSPIARDYVERLHRDRRVALLISQTFACAACVLMAIGAVLMANAARRPARALPAVATPLEQTENR